MKYDELDAGPEMDRLCVEKVMGWQKEKWDRNGNRSSGVLWSTEEGARHPAAFCPSTNIAHAWEVVERMRQRSLFANVMQRQEVAHCTFEDYDGLEVSRWKAKTAPLAICKAAIKASGEL